MKEPNPTHLRGRQWNGRPRGAVWKPANVYERRRFKSCRGHKEKPVGNTWRGVYTFSEVLVSRWLIAQRET